MLNDIQKQKLKEFEKKAIIAGETDVIKSKIKDEKENIYPTNGNLDIKWFLYRGVRYYTIICSKCENNKLIKASRGLRCVSCGLFHSWSSWTKVVEQVYKISNWNDGKIEKVKQPNEQYKQLNRKIVYNVHKKQWVVKPKTDDDLKNEFHNKIK